VHRGIRDAIDRWQRRHGVAAFPAAVLRKYLDDRGSSLAALLAFYAFFSVFPLLLAFVSVLGFLLEDDPSLHQQVLDSALAQLPIVGAQLGDEIEPLTGNSVALAVGVAGALWGGLGVTLALGRAFDVVSDVPRVEQRSGLRARARGALLLGILGTMLVAASGLTGLAARGRLGGPTVEQLGALLISLTVNSGILLAAFALLTARPRRLRDLLPGVALAAVGVFVLQSAGAWYLDYTVSRASDTYGTFALVIGLLSWFLLVGNLIVLCAEVNAVRRWRLWPRSLSGALEPADELAMRRKAAAARRDPRQEIEVRFVDLDPP
jgi:YihY family inner membrane protein